MVLAVSEESARTGAARISDSGWCVHHDGAYRLRRGGLRPPGPPRELQRRVANYPLSARRPRRSPTTPAHSTYTTGLSPHRSATATTQQGPGCTRLCSYPSALRHPPFAQCGSGPTPPTPTSWMGNFQIDPPTPLVEVSLVLAAAARRGRGEHKCSVAAFRTFGPTGSPNPARASKYEPKSTNAPASQPAVELAIVVIFALAFFVPTFRGVSRAG
jgi:hypothetical protein